MASRHGPCRGCAPLRLRWNILASSSVPAPSALGAVAAAANAKLADGVDPDLALKDVRPLDEAGEGDLSFIDNPKYLPAFATTGASACLVAPKFANQAPAGTACLVTPEPYRGFARALLLFYPDALKPKAAASGGLPVAPDRQTRARRDC